MNLNPKTRFSRVWWVNGLAPSSSVSRVMRNADLLVVFFPSRQLISGQSGLR